jgi:hypothetical protein
MPKREVFAPIVVTMLAVVAPEAAHAQSYNPGFTWSRFQDWAPGPVAGLPIGNPAPDSNGVGVYSYEWTSGDGLGSQFEWFENPGVPLVWDDEWFNSGQGAWTRANDTNPPIFKNRLTHNLIGDNFDFVPAVRWNNPIPGGTLVDITGRLTVLWSGNNFVGAPTDVDVVISIFNPNPDSPQQVLFAQTVSKPNPGLTVGDIAELDVDLTDIEIEDLSVVTVSIRGQDRMAGEGRWVVLYDQDLNMTVVPAPGMLAFGLGMPILALGRRRRV